jgi:uncharacterized OsmC-like protein
MHITTRCVGGRKFEMQARDHRVLSDQPLSNDGTDTAMTPPELFLSSMGACAAFYAHEYLQVRGLPADDVEVHVSAEKGARPVRLESLVIDVIAPGLNQRHRDGVLRAVDACLLKHTLQIPPRIAVHVNGSLDAVEHELTIAEVIA